MPPRRSYLALLWPFAYMTGIYILSSIPGTANPAAQGVAAFVLWAPPYLQDLLHIPLYGGLAFLWQRALRSWVARASGAVGLAAGLSAAHAVYDEYHQLSVPGRYFSGTDLLFDAAGICAGLVLSVWLRRAAR